MTVKYKAVRNILSSLFSVETGLDDSYARVAYCRALASDGVLREQVLNAFQDESVSWREMLFNSEYEVYEADTEDEARELAVQWLLVPLNKQLGQLE